ncbi:MAG TPA: archaeosortase A [Candidatus Methanoperedens sp.]
MTIILWIALGLLALASMLPNSGNLRFLSGGLGWISLSIYWFQQPQAYIGIQDYFNAFLVVIAALASILIAWITFRSKNGQEREQRDIFSLARAAAAGGLIYFMFAEVNTLNTGIISMVTDQAIWLIQKIGFPVVKVAWNELAINGMVVEIILACTAIESIALFMGVISSADGAPLLRKSRAFLVSVPVIYILNIQRVSFTASAYGFAWFGTAEESFHIAEHFITKIGSMLALLLISYVVLKMLPEVSDMIEGVLKMMKIELHRFTSRQH